MKIPAVVRISMEFGLLTIPRDSNTFLNEVRAAKRQKFDFLGVPDSQCLVQELFTNLGAAAMETEQIGLGPSVTNPVTRHPAVTASALCALDEHSCGRAVLGVASADSAVYTLGKRPATVKQLQEFVEIFIALSRGERIEYEGETFGLTWLRQQDEAREIPVMIAAEGPTTLRLAGKVADRALIGLGVTPRVVERAVEYVNEGAREANRDPDDVKKWVYARAAVVDDLATVEENLEDVVAASAHHALQFTFEGKQVPSENAADVHQLVREYDSEQHVGLGDESLNRQLMHRLGLTDYLTERFAIAGSPEEWIERIEQLHETRSVHGLHLHPVHDDPRQFIERMGEEVLPEL